MKRECAAPGKFLIASANVDVNKSFESFTMDVVKNSIILMMSWQKRYFGNDKSLCGVFMYTLMW